MVRGVLLYGMLEYAVMEYSQYLILSPILGVPPIEHAHFCHNNRVRSGQEEVGERVRYWCPKGHPEGLAYGLKPLAA